MKNNKFSTLSFPYFGAAKGPLSFEALIIFFFILDNLRIARRAVTGEFSLRVHESAPTSSQIL